MVNEQPPKPGTPPPTRPPRPGRPPAPHHPRRYDTDPVYRAHVKAVAASLPPLTPEQLAIGTFAFTSARRRLAEQQKERAA